MAQKNTFVQYTVNDGLPSNNVYQAIQDQQGYMWFATDGGVVKFDGRNWKEFTVNDGLPTNDIYQMVEDPNGRIWLQGVSNVVSYIEGDSVKVFEVDDSCFNKTEKLNLTTIGLDQGFIKIIYVNTVIVVNSSLQIECVHTETKKVVNENIQLNDVDKSDGKFSAILDTRIFHTPNKLYLLDSVSTLIDSFELKKPLLIFKIPVNRDNFKYNNFLFLPSIDKGQLFVFAIDSFELLKIIDFKDEFGKNPSHFRYEITENVIQIQSNLGVVILDLEKLKNSEYGCTNSIKIEEYYDSEKINRVFLDKHANVWILTNNEGVIFIPEYQHKNETSGRNNHLLRSLMLLNNKIYTGDKFGIVRDETKNFTLNFKSNEADNSVNQIAYNEINNDLIILKDGQGMLIYNFEDKSISSFMDIYSTKWGEQKKTNLKQEEVFDVSKYKFHLALPNSITVADDKLYYCINEYIFKLNARDYNIENIVKLDSRKLIVNDDTLYTYSRDNLNLLTSSLKLLKTYKFEKSIKDIDKFDEGVLVLLSNGNLYYLYSENDPMLVSVNIKPNNGELLFIDELVWVTSNTAIYAYSYFDKQLFLEKYKSCEGIKDFIVKDDTLFIAGDSGFLNFGIDFENDFISTAPIIIKVSDVITNKNLTNQTKLGYHENNLKFNFDYLDYQSQGKYTIDLKMISHDTISISSEGGEFLLPNLSPSDYLLEYQITDFLGRRSQIYSYKFTIMGPWWTNIFFLIFFIFSLLIFGFYIYVISSKRIIRKEQEKTEINKKMAELKLSALQSQMNPHFIFNSLNSIQHLIQLNDPKNADIYLTNFSQLLRSFLENSKDKFVSVAKEMELLRNYCNLEKLRFGNKHKIEILTQLTNQEEEAMLIPTNIIQPIVENAINHGLFHKVDSGFLSISSYFYDDQLIVTIEDNGIGRVAAAKLSERSNKNHRSLGSDIVKEKLDILSRVEGYNVIMQIEDLVDQKNHAVGTKVILKFLKN